MALDGCVGCHKSSDFASPVKLSAIACARDLITLLAVVAGQRLPTRARQAQLGALGAEVAGVAFTDGPWHASPCGAHCSCAAAPTRETRRSSFFGFGLTAVEHSLAKSLDKNFRRNCPRKYHQSPFNLPPSRLSETPVM